MNRPCSKQGCASEAAFTLTYDYESQIAAIGPLSPSIQSEGYDLCPAHARSFSAPREWRVIRHLSLSSDQS